MPRGTTSGLNSAFAAQVFYPILFVDLTFGGSHLRLCDQSRTVNWNSQDWLGNGMLRAPVAVDESAELQATGCDITLGGVDSTLLSAILGSAKHSDTATIWIGALDPSTFSVVADPVQIFDGHLDVPELQESGTASAVVIHYESDLADLDRVNDLRLTDEAQQSVYDGDTGFSFVPQTVEKRLYWGKAAKPAVKLRGRDTTKAKPNSRK